MRIDRWVVAVMITMAAGSAAGARGQEVALKGGIALSRFAVDGSTPFDKSLTSTQFGGHFRFTLGPIPLQPELYFVTRGGKLDDTESIRLEYMEIPMLVALPVRAGDFELFAVGGPMIALEARCRHVVEADGLKTTFGCDPPRPPAFRRRAFDYGAVAGAGIGHRLGSGRLFLEGRHTWGLRNIYRGPDDTQLRNRTFSFMLGYVMMWESEQGF